MMIKGIANDNMMIKGIANAIVMSLLDGDVFHIYCTNNIACSQSLLIVDMWHGICKFRRISNA
jgi:hypothetical protein